MLHILCHTHTQEKSFIFYLFIFYFMELGLCLWIGGKKIEHFDNLVILLRICSKIKWSKQRCRAQRKDLHLKSIELRVILTSNFKKISVTGFIFINLKVSVSFCFLHNLWTLVVFRDCTIWVLTYKGLMFPKFETFMEIMRILV